MLSAVNGKHFKDVIIINQYFLKTSPNGHIAILMEGHISKDLQSDDYCAKQVHTTNEEKEHQIRELTVSLVLLSGPLC